MIKSLIISSLQQLPLLLLLSFPILTQATFNYEVERRVFERIDDFMSGPMIVTGLLERFLENGAFPNDVDVRDRDIYSTLSFSLLNEYKFDMLYYGTEDGVFVGYNEGAWGTYREPVDSGYSVGDPDMQQYFQACVNRETGKPENCTTSAGSEYVNCIRGCELQLCNDTATQACDDGTIACARSQKWCPSYSIETVTEEIAPRLGYVPRTYHCHTAQGVFSQQPGAILQQDGTLGNCLYEDKETLVNRNTSGEFLYCQGGECDTVFAGGFRSRDYDPRYREWYTQTKDLQKANWAAPYPFFTNLEMGITYSAPFYTEDEDRRQIFRGVFAVDYTFEDMNGFLVDSYGVGAVEAQENYQETYVVIYEKKEPHYIIASSTGRSGASKVLEGDETTPCPDDSDDNIACTVKRVPMKEVEGKPFDLILQRSYTKQDEMDYPRDLVSVQLSDESGSPAYASQSSFYSGADGLEWIILVISPVEESTTDALTAGQELFGVVCVVASVGFLLCLAMFVSFFLKRKSRAIILADWRFTSAFLLGCALLNISSFTFLGENTEALCLARMWTFHLLFAVALSPLFVKIYRMYRLIGTPNRNPAVISNPQAVAMSLPIVLTQVIILAIFTIADPPTPEDVILVDETVVTQSVECTTSSDAFFFTVITFECTLVVIGCVLAFITRNMDSGFGQAKELGFAMYNIAFIGLIIGVITFTMDIDMTGQIVLFSMGIFCGTVFSSAAFVVPRLIQSKQETSSAPTARGSGSGGSGNRTSRVRKPTKSNLKRSRVNFSEDVGREMPIAGERERPVTGWSAVEEEDDAASGLKRASSIGSLNEDDAWTMNNGSVGASIADSKSYHSKATNAKSAKDDTTWNEGDLLSDMVSLPTTKKDVPPEPNEAEEKMNMSSPSVNSGLSV